MTKKLELIDLFYSSKKKSIKWKKYFHIYEKLFSKYKNEKITFVEVGILDGGSLEIWKNYFGKNSRIIGIDINPLCKKFESQNCEIFIGSQSDPNFWRHFYDKVGKVDLILDDGGHTNDQQIITLTESVKFINNGGMIVVEDVHTSYQKHYGNPYKYSFINFSKKIIDDVNSKFPNIKKFDYSLNDYIYSIEFLESIVAFKIDKNLCYENKLLENNGISSQIEDLTLDNNVIKLRKKFDFFYKFKILSKIERLFIKYLYKIKSNRLKNFFK